MRLKKVFAGVLAAAMLVCAVANVHHGNHDLPAKTYGLAGVFKKGHNATSFYLQFTMQCFSQGAPIAPGDRPAVACVAS